MDTSERIKLSSGRTVPKCQCRLSASCHLCLASIFCRIPLSNDSPRPFLQTKATHKLIACLPQSLSPPRAMWGSLAVQPLVQWSGRAQTVTAITSLRQFGRVGSSAAAAPPTPWALCRPWPFCCAAAGAALPSYSRLQQRWAAWRRPVAQQLHTIADPAGVAACAIQPGEVHLWWLDPSQVGCAAPMPGTGWAACIIQLQGNSSRSCCMTGDTSGPCRSAHGGLSTPLSFFLYLLCAGGQRGRAAALQ